MFLVARSRQVSGCEPPGRLAMAESLTQRLHGCRIADVPCGNLRAAAAGQMILEELLLGDVHLHPYELLGWEGLFGTLFMICLSLPIVGIIPGATGFCYTAAYWSGGTGFSMCRPHVSVLLGPTASRQCFMRVKHEPMHSRAASGQSPSKGLCRAAGCHAVGQDAGRRLENTADTLAMLHNSRKIAAVDGVVFASALLVNVASVLRVLSCQHARTRPNCLLLLLTTVLQTND